MSLPLEWSPDLRLVDLAVNIQVPRHSVPLFLHRRLQMLMLNPSSLAVSNIEASIVSNESPRVFLQQIRQTLTGVTISDVAFPRIAAVCEMCRDVNYPRRVSWEGRGSSASGRKRRSEDAEIPIEDPSDIFDLAVLARCRLDPDGRGSDTSSLKRICTIDHSGRSSFDSDHLTGSVERVLSVSVEDLTDACIDVEDEDFGFEMSGIPDHQQLGDAGSISPPLDVSYRTYSAKSEERSRSVESLPILAHLPIIRRQISRTISSDEWDFDGPKGERQSSFVGSRTSPMRDSHGDLIFRRTSIFAVNSGPADFDARIRR